jgi:hypothetical protein
MDAADRDRVQWKTDERRKSLKKVLFFAICKMVPRFLTNQFSPGMMRPGPKYQNLPKYQGVLTSDQPQEVRWGGVRLDFWLQQLNGSVS